jgi:hypothetical protein
MWNKGNGLLPRPVGTVKDHLMLRYCYKIKSPVGKKNFINIRGAHDCLVLIFEPQSR